MTDAARLQLSTCPDCGYDLRAHQPPGTCPECGETIEAGAFDVPVRRVRESLVPWAVLLDIAFIAIAALMLSRGLWMVGAAVLVLLIGRWLLRRRARAVASAEGGGPRLVVSPERIAIMRGRAIHGGWPTRTFERVELRTPRRGPPRLLFYDALGVSFIVTLLADEAAARRIAAAIDGLIERARPQ